MKLQDSDFDDVFRVGPKSRDRQRPVVVRFTTHRIRSKVSSLETRKKLPRGVYENDDLTRARSNLLFRARCLVKSKALSRAWSAGGNIFVRDNSGNKHRVDNDDALEMLKGIGSQ